MQISVVISKIFIVKSRTMIVFTCNMINLSDTKQGKICLKDLTSVSFKQNKQQSLKFENSKKFTSSNPKPSKIVLY